jgi:IS4 transposase
MDFSQYNGKPYLLTYKIRSVDSIYIDAERISNECDMEYSNIKSITRGNESFERVNNRYLITIR